MNLVNKKEQIFLYDVSNKNTQDSIIVDKEKRLWEVFIGPFPMRSNVTISIEQKRKLSKEDIDNITYRIRRFLIYEILNFPDGLSNDSIKKLIVSRLEKEISKDDVISKNIKLKDSIVGFVNSNLNYNFNNFKQTILMKDEEIKNWLTDYGRKVFDSLNISYSRSNVPLIEQKLKIINSLLSSNETNHIIFKDTILIKSYFLEYKNYISNLVNLIDGIKNSLKNYLINSSTLLSTSTNFVVEGIASYLGVSLGINYVTNFKDIHIMPIFVNISGYLKKTDPEQDYVLSKKTIWNIFYPTIGFSIKNDNELKPIYTVGIGCRLNKAIRFFIGTTLPNQKNNYYTWNGTFGLAITSEYLSEFLKIITTLKSD